MMAMAVAMFMSAYGVKVHDTVNKGDARWMSTGCRYENAFSSAGSVGIWVRNVSESSNPGMLVGCAHVNQTSSPDEGFMLYIDGGQVKFRVIGSTAGGERSYTTIAATDSESLLNDGSWHFFLGTFDLSAGKARLYVDGQLSASADMSIASLMPSRCLTVSCCGKTTEATTHEKENYGAAFKGLFAEVSLWSRALSAADVSALNVRRAIPWEDGLIGYWPLANDNKNWAVNAVTRADGSRPDAMFYFGTTVEDADFFDMPSGKFVVSPEWSAAHGYTMPEGATFNTVADSATNIQAAVVAAASGETVYVLPGTYPLETAIGITNKNITLTSWNWYSAAPSRDTTILDGKLRTRVLDVYNYNSGYKMTVRGFTVTNGVNIAVLLGGGNPSQTYETALQKNNFLEDCRVTGSVRTDGGASAIYVSKLGVVTNCVVNGNRAANGAAIGWTTDYGAGNALYPGKEYMFRRVTITDCDIEDNVNAGNSGTAIGATNCGILDRCRFRRNYNTGNAKAICVLPSGSSVFDCTFEDMPGQAADAVTPARILDLGGGSCVVSNCIFRGNSVGNYIFACLDSPQTAKVWNLVVTNNTVGGAALIGRMEVRNSLIVGNGSGAGVQSHNMPGFIFENTTISGFANGVYVSGQVTNVFVNSILWGNTTDISFNSGTPSSLYITNSVVAEIGAHTVLAEDIVNRYTFNPRFADAEHGDYTLKLNSPCRDKGVKLEWMADGSLDLAGLPRVVDYSGIPFTVDARPDLGCYEIQDCALGFMIIFQ